MTKVRADAEKVKTVESMAAPVLVVRAYVIAVQAPELKVNAVIDLVMAVPAIWYVPLETVLAAKVYP
jgi:hypothetical protein